MKLAIKTKSLMLLLALLITSGCVGSNNRNGSFSRAVNAEKLLAATGQWDIVDANEGTDPLKQHMKARGMVNPAVSSRTKKYTSYPKDSEINEDEHFRVLRFKDINTREDNQGNLAIASRTHYKTTAHKIAVKPGIKPIRTAINDKSIVTGIRIGRHPDKTRFVLDMGETAKFNATMDNKENVLFIELYQTKWIAPKKGEFKGHSLVKGYEIRENLLGDTVMAVKFNKPARLVFSTAYKPDQHYGHRIIIDVADALP